MRNRFCTLHFQIKIYFKFSSLLLNKVCSYTKIDGKIQHLSNYPVSELNNSGCGQVSHELCISFCNKYVECK